MKNMTFAVAVAGAVIGVLTSSNASAQEASGAVTAQATATPTASNPAPVAVATASVAREDETPDHERFVGHFAVGYFGISALPIAQAAGNNVTAGAVQAPVIGVR